MCKNNDITTYIIYILATCEGKADGIYCNSGNCCGKSYRCADNEMIREYTLSNTTLCYDGKMISWTDDRCENIICGEHKCGDGICTDDESCNSCPEDCGGCISCGDNVCSLGETCENCPNDCGTCTASTNPIENNNNTMSKLLIAVICVGLGVVGLVGAAIKKLNNKRKRKIINEQLNSNGNGKEITPISKSKPERRVIGLEIDTENLTNDVLRKSLKPELLVSIPRSPYSPVNRLKFDRPLYSPKKLPLTPKSRGSSVEKGSPLEMSLKN